MPFDIHFTVSILGFVHVQLCCTLIGGGYSNDSNVVGEISISLLSYTFP